MIRCGELCQSCFSFCAERVSESNAIEIECVVCEGLGLIESDTECDRCNGRGSVEITTCPKAMIDYDMMDTINLATFAEKGFLPEPGGILDQNVHWLNVWSRLSRDTAKIENQQRERRIAKWQAT